MVSLSTSSSNPVRAFGRFELRRLLGRSAGTMAWLAHDPETDTDVMLTLPRVQPADADALERWLADARLAARVDHPRLAPVAEVAVHEHWPYIAVDRRVGVTLGEWLAGHAQPPPADVAAWFCDLLQGLAFAHDAGVAHHDLQLHALLVDERGHVSLMALGGVCEQPHGRADTFNPTSYDRSLAMPTSELRARRAAAARDLLACGVLLHQLLAGKPALEQPDIALACARITPEGREIVRLPWTTPLPIPEALRAIANRATAGQERLRYPNSRSLLRALTGWLEAQSADGGGPVALLLDRLHAIGHLPALPGLAARVARVTSLESQRTDEIADQALQDMALSFELLRTLNSAQVQGTQVPGNGPVLTLRRIISLIGVNGVRLAANTLREWPGPLSEEQAAALHKTLERVRLAGHVAQALRPAGYDAQVIFLIAALQNLGRLMVAYHFADEAAQIRDLTLPTPPDRQAGTPEQPGLPEEAAAFAVLGVDIESLGSAVGTYWGLGPEVMHMVRRLPAGAPVRKPDTDAAVLRLTASAANDAVDAASGPPGPKTAAAVAQVAQRYARALGIGPRDLTDALQAARESVRKGAPLPQPRRGDTITDLPASTLPRRGDEAPTGSPAR
jgi:non-specific serine/threonine protein kinase